MSFSDASMFLGGSGNGQRKFGDIDALFGFEKVETECYESLGA